MREIIEHRAIGHHVDFRVHRLCQQPTTLLEIQILTVVKTKCGENGIRIGEIKVGDNLPRAAAEQGVFIQRVWSEPSADTRSV